MLSVILTILKVIGILILVLLGILLTVLLLILLVPIRYYAKGSYYGELKGEAKVTWLLHILSVKVTYDKEPDISIRILGIPLGQKHKTKEKHKAKEKQKETELFPDEDQILTAQELPPPKGNIKQAQTFSKQENKEGLFQRITQRIKLFFEKLKFSFRQMCAKLKDIKASFQTAKIWFEDEGNKQLFRLLIRQLKKLMKHILPRKANGKITFGFDDPYTTGQVLSYFSMVYPMCHKQLKVCPVFGEAVFEGEGCVKGRIRIGTLLVLGLRILWNKQFRVLLKKFLG